jgi:acyl-CoA reductase-like NAD-dependent aldehyde dehydrogenase
MELQQATDLRITAAAYIGGSWREQSGKTSQIADPYRLDVIGEASASTLDDLDAALDSARAGSEAMARMPGHVRAELLRRMADEVQAVALELATLMTRETGKAIADSIIEVDRASSTLRLCAEETVRIEGQHIPMDASAMGAGKIALITRFPVGVVSAITPFNAPINMIAHKLGPALAAGNAVIIKPSPKAPLCAYKFVEALSRAGAPVGSISLLFGDEVSTGMVSDPRVDAISFTGSIPVGKLIRANAGMRKVVLELGGVGPTFVAADADLEQAAIACARNGVLIAGQSCISVQNIHVDESVAAEFTDLLVEQVSKVRFGDPLAQDSEVGTLIDQAAADRVMGMVRQATSRGANLLIGGEQNGAQMNPVVLSNVDSSMEVVTDEIFGPVMSVQPYQDTDAIFNSISKSPYGLQCGIFTSSIGLALDTYRKVRTGGVIVNGTSRWRVDQMPYGGVKDSGVGKEGPKFAIRDLTEERLLVLNQ